MVSGRTFDLWIKTDVALRLTFKLGRPIKSHFGLGGCGWLEVDKKLDCSLFEFSTQFNI